MSALVSVLWFVLAFLCLCMAARKPAEPPKKSYVIHWEYPTDGGRVVYNVEGELIDGKFSIMTSDGHFIERKER